MPPLAQRNLFHDKVRLTVTLTGIVFCGGADRRGAWTFRRIHDVTTSNLIDHSGR